MGSPPALPREQSGGGAGSKRRAHRKVPQAGERKGPAEQNRHGPSAGRGGRGRGRAGWRVGTAPSGGLKTTRWAGWLQRLLRRLGAFLGVGRAGCGPGPAERAARAVLARGRRGRRGPRRAHAPRRVTCGGSGAEGRPRRAPGGARSGAPALGPATLPRADGGDRAPSLLEAAGSGFLSGENPAVAPSVAFEVRLRAPRGARRDKGAPLPRRTRSSSPLGEVCSARPPAAVWPPGAPEQPKTTNEPTNSSTKTPKAGVGSHAGGLGLLLSSLLTHLGCNATDSYVAPWTQQLVRAFDV